MHHPMTSGGQHIAHPCFQKTGRFVFVLYLTLKGSIYVISQNMEHIVSSYSSPLPLIFLQVPLASSPVFVVQRDFVFQNFIKITKQ